MTLMYRCRKCGMTLTMQDQQKGDGLLCDKHRREKEAKAAADREAARLAYEAEQGMK